MKALVPDATADCLVVFDEVEEPSPDADEAVIQVAAFSINRGETFVLEQRPVDWRPGKDVAGVVVRAAADGSGPPQGSRVVAHPPSRGWAERVAVNTRQIATLSEFVSDLAAAALPLAGLTALRLLRAAGPVASRRVLMTEAAGGVGHYFAELASGCGADLTMVVSTPARGERLKALGAQAVVHDVSDADGSFDVVLEFVGGASFETALGKLRPRGEFIWFGRASRKLPSLDFFQFWDGPVSASIKHFDYTDSDIPDGRDLETLVSFVRDGRLHPEIGLVADWGDTPAVLTALRDRGVRGNAVLTLASARA